MCVVSLGYIVGVVSLCRAPPTEEAECTEGAVRLVAGSSDTGRVEMCKYGQWGAVCADNEWDDTDAETVCRQLSLPGKQ